MEYTTPLQDAWREGRLLAVHGWIHGLSNGLRKDLGFSAASPSEPRESEELSAYAGSFG